MLRKKPEYPFSHGKRGTNRFKKPFANALNAGRNFMETTFKITLVKARRQEHKIFPPHGKLKKKEKYYMPSRAQRNKIGPPQLKFKKHSSATSPSFWVKNSKPIYRLTGNLSFKMSQLISTIRRNHFQGRK